MKPERVEDYLKHIAEAIERATRYLQPVPDLAALEKNTQVQDAVVRNVEVIGEAVNNIQRTAPNFIRQHPQLPWAQMRAMRNVMIHEYFSSIWERSGRPLRTTCPSSSSRSTVCSLI
jgi:uncharacterized protein with HEPN domain